MLDKLIGVYKHGHGNNEHGGNDYYGFEEHKKIVHYQQPHVVQPHHNGKITNGWQMPHEDANHVGHGMHPHGGHNTHNNGHGTQQYHGAHKMQHHDVHGTEHHDVHGTEHHGGNEIRLQDRLMTNVYMNPVHDVRCGGRTEVVTVSEKWGARNNSGGGGHQKVGWVGKGL
ncbi:unnamed protein product [Cochlearia groenlandica]